MAYEKQKFEDLLKEAPKAPSADTVSLVGALAQAHEAGKFVLTMAGGQTVTLDVSAVKDHEVMASSVGHVIVRVDIDRAHLPVVSGPGDGTTAVAADTARQGLDQVFTQNGDVTLRGSDNINVKFIWEDVHYQTGRTTAFLDQNITFAFADNPLATGIGDFGGVGTIQETVPDYGGGLVNPAAGAMPFSLATQHQAPPAMLAALGNLPKFTHDPHPPKLIYDPPTLPWPWGYRDFP
jgi:hypothetical protein